MAPPPTVPSLIALGAGLAVVLLAGCGRESGVALRGGQTASQLAEERRQCLPFVQANFETPPELAEAACLIARGYRAELPLTQGPAGMGSLYVAAKADAKTLVEDFRGCRVEALDSPLPVNRDKGSSGIFTSLYEEFFPRGMFSHPRTPEEWALQIFAGCLKRRGYAVSDVTPPAR